MTVFLERGPKILVVSGRRELVGAGESSQLFNIMFLFSVDFYGVSIFPHWT